MVMLVLCGSRPAVAQEEPAKAPAERDPTNAAPVDPLGVYSGGQFEEVYIDEEFKLYKVRTYQGVVPGRDEKEGAPVEVPAEAPKGTKISVNRIGFEQRELFSRVFVVTSHPVTPWVYDNFVQAKSTPGVEPQIYVELAGAVVPKSNDRRPLDTRGFSTPVASIEGFEQKSGARVVLTLKREARYLPVTVGNVLYIDVER